MSNKADYLALCHAMQSGVAYKMNIDGKETEPKHLRVGVNSALVSNAALLDLLVEKGLITSEEYEVKLNVWMKQEVKMYEEFLTKHFGKPVTLS